MSGHVSSRQVADPWADLEDRTDSDGSEEDADLRDLGAWDFPDDDNTASASP